MMKKYVFPALVAFVFIAAISSWFIWWRPLGQASDRLIDKLYGQVQQVVIENAPIVERFGEWVETARSTESATLYDEQGQVSEIRRYRPDNQLDYRITYTYSEDKLLGETSFDPRGTI